MRDRAGGMTRMVSVLARARRVPDREGRGDPITIARRALKKFPVERERIDREVEDEIGAAVAAALAGSEGGGRA